MGFQWSLTLSETQMMLLRLARAETDLLTRMLAGEKCEPLPGLAMSHWLTGSRILTREGYIETRYGPPKPGQHKWSGKDAERWKEDPQKLGDPYHVLTEKGQHLWRIIEISMLQTASEATALSLMFKSMPYGGLPGESERQANAVLENRRAVEEEDNDPQLAR